MTKDQRKQMKSYLRPQQVFYGSGEDDYSVRLSMAMTCKAKLGGHASIEKLEEIVLDVYAWCIERDRNYIPSLFIREVKKRYIRWMYKEQGLTQRGTVPVKGRAFHISNEYSEDGENLLDDKTHGDYEWEMEYDEDGNAKF